MNCLREGAGSPFSRMPSLKQKAGYDQHTNPSIMLTKEASNVTVVNTDLVESRI